MKTIKTSALIFLFCATACSNFIGSNGSDGQMTDDRVVQARDNKVEQKSVEIDKKVPPKLCVFDYDLTLSSHLCPGVSDEQKVCPTYEWDMQGISPHAKDAIKRCIAEGAYVGILSLASIDCFKTKIPALLDKVPELKDLLSPDGKKVDISSIEQWNQSEGPFHFEPQADKAKDIDRIMRFYGLKPVIDDHLVIFWDDEPYNISRMKKKRPKINSVELSRISNNPHSGCGIKLEDIDEGFKKLNDQNQVK